MKKDLFIKTLKAFPFCKKYPGFSSIQFKDNQVSMTDGSLSVSFNTPVGLENLQGVFNAEKIIKLDSKFEDFSEKDSEFVFSNPGSMVLRRSMEMIDFPQAFPDLKNGTKLFDMPYREFQRGIDFVIPCTSQDDFRRHLNGIYFDIENQALVSTDGRRLAHYDFTMTGEEGKIIPLTVFNFLKKIGIKDNQTISASLYKDHIQFEFMGLTIVTVYVDGCFPNWKQVVPKPEAISSVWSFNTKDKFVKAIENFATMKYNKGDIPPIAFDIRGEFSKENETVVITDGENSKFQSEWGKFSVETSGMKSIRDCKMYMNTEFFLDAVHQFNGDVKFKFESDHPLRAILMVDKPGEFIIIMPRKRDWK